VVATKLSTEEIREWVMDRNAVKPKIMKKLDSMGRFDILKQVSKPDMLRLLQVYKDKAFAIDPNANWHELCYTGSLCGIDMRDNPTRRQAIMCMEECPLVPRKGK
jgi:hypothetical protein